MKKLTFAALGVVVLGSMVAIPVASKAFPGTNRPRSRSTAPRGAVTTMVDDSAASATRQEVRGEQDQAEYVRTLTALELKVAALASEVGSNAPASSESAPHSNAQTPRSEAELEHELQAELDATLASEPRDARWANATETEVQQLLAQVLPASHGITVSCKSTLCRSQLNLADSEAHREFISQFTAQLRWPGAGYIYSTTEGGQQRTVVYLSKPGVELPTPRG